MRGSLGLLSARSPRYGEALGLQPITLELLPQPPNKWGVSAKKRVPFWGPYNKDCSIVGSILGFAYFGKLPYEL